MMNSPFLFDTKTVNYIIGDGALEQAAKLFTQYQSVFILMDKNVEKFCLDVLMSKLPDIKVRGYIKIPAGESSKSIEHATHIWESLTNMGASRDSLLINLGGGVVSDIGGFCASTFKRGLPFINIPTTLLAQVDASIGGKTGIDFLSFKNQVGLFVDPKAVVIDPVFLKTLEFKYWQSGFAEVTKHALIMDKELWKLLGDRKFTEIEEWNKIIMRSAKDKIDIVRYDKTEHGIRKILNFGHTIGHAIETFSFQNDNDFLLHGEAVAIGMICELYISSKVTRLPKNEMEEVIEYITSLFKHYPLRSGNFDLILDIIKHDKKNSGDKFNFTLLTTIGNSMINQEVDAKLILESLRFYQSLES